MFIPDKNVIAHLHAQDALTQNETLFRALFENSSDIIVLVTAEGLISYVSPSITRILGHPSEEIVGRHVPLLIHPDDLALMQGVFADVLQSPRESLRAEYRLRHCDGSWRWFEGVGMNVLDDPGVEAIVINFRDITDRKQSEDQLLFQADILRNVTESVIVTDLKGSIIYWNEEAQRVFGYTPEEMLGKTTSELYPDSDTMLLAHDLENILAGKDFVGVWLGRRKDGTSVWIDIKTTLLRDSRGAAHGFIGIAKDITSRKVVEQALDIQQQEFQAIAEHARDIISRFDLAYRHVYVNPAIEAFTGLPRHTFIGKTFEELGMPDSLASDWKAALRKVFETGQEEIIEFAFPSPMDSKWFESHLIPEYAHDRTVASVLVIAREFTERKRAEEQLKASEERLRALLEHSADAISLLDHRGRRMYATPSSARIIGYEPTDYLGEGTIEQLHPDDVSQVQQIFTAIIEQPGLSLPAQFRARHKNGSWVWLEGTGTNLLDHPSIQAIVVNYRDITERKQAEEALRQSEENFRVLAASLPEIVWTATPEGSIQYYNQRWYDYTGFEPASKQPEAWSAIIHPDDLSHVLARWEIAHTTGEPFEAEYRLKRADGMYRWHLGRSIAIKEKDGIINKWFGTATDITDQKEAEQQKDEFISIASHELKTPVTTIKGLTQLLKRRLERQGATELVSILASVETQINRLTRLVNDLLDSSKIQAGRLDYVQEAVDLDALVHNIIETMQLTTTTHTISIHGASHASIKGDRDKLEQVFINLISNAIKYSPQATSVDIHLAVSYDMVMVSVHDNGVGIPEEQQHKIFERFYRAQDSTDRAAPGLGMGLYIASEIVKRHHGKITVTSEEGKGSTFTVYLPLES